jgi:hypothetical protein
MQAASDFARRTAPSARPGIARSTGPGSATATACSTPPRRPLWPTAWLAGAGAWSATCRPIGTCTSPPWLAPPEGAPGGTGRGTGAKAMCSPLLAATAEVDEGRHRTGFATGRRDASACRCCELERVPADGSGRRPVPPADAHESWWDGVPGRERPPFCGAWVAPPPSWGVAHAPAVRVRTSCVVGRRWPCRCDLPSRPKCAAHLLRHVARNAGAQPVANFRQ